MGDVLLLHPWAWVALVQVVDGFRHVSHQSGDILWFELLTACLISAWKQSLDGPEGLNVVRVGTASWAKMIPIGVARWRRTFPLMLPLTYVSMKLILGLERDLASGASVLPRILGVDVWLHQNHRGHLEHRVQLDLRAIAYQSRIVGFIVC